MTSDRPDTRQPILPWRVLAGVVAVPDGRKGEQVVLVTDAADADRIALVGWARNHGVSELTVPRRVLVVDAIPLLATGKTDYVTVQKLVQEPFQVS